MWNRLFWKDAAERAVSTAAQAFLAVVGAEVFNVLDFDWTNAAAIAAGAGVLAVVKALAAAKLVQTNELSPASLVTNDPDDLP